MNGMDIFIIIVISFGLIRGFFRGFIREVASIIGVMAGFYGAYTYYRVLAIYLEPWIKNWGAYGNIACFCLLFCLIVSMTAIMAHIIKEFLKIVFLGWVDKLFGMVFGAFKGLLVASVVFIMFTAFLPGEPEFITKSTLTPYVAHVSEMATIFISRELKGDLKAKIERIKEIWEQQRLSIQEKMTESLTQKAVEKIKTTVAEKEPLPKK
ncbi:MAG: CvpA family protein [Desulfamplus sp.]|nr:CvpA family protein [Desulfamplus sp.]